jgi:lysophospholipase L1-like esterase
LYTLRAPVRHDVAISCSIHLRRPDVLPIAAGIGPFVDSRPRRWLSFQVLRDARLVRLLVLMMTACAVTVPLCAQVPPAPTFTDNPLQPGVTPIKVVHLTELRGAIDSLRSRYGVPAMTWTDATLSPGVTPARAVHLAELRTALDDVYAAALRTPPVYTNSPPSAGVTVITAAHVNELRGGVLAIWNLGPPTISSISPDVGPAAGGTAVTILGTNFVNPSVLVGGLPATSVVPVNAGTITATTGAHAVGTVDVTVTNRDGQVAVLPASFGYHLPPTVSSVAPAVGSAAGGNSVNVNGTNFDCTPGHNVTVRIGGVVASGIGYCTATLVIVLAPAGAMGTYDVTATNPDGLSGLLQNGYSYTAPAPTIGSVTPSQGPTAGGTAITIGGTNFRSGATVTLGGTAATGVTVVSATQITATTAAHATGAVDVVVTNVDQTMATKTGGFTYGSPAFDYLAFGDSITAGLSVDSVQYYAVSNPMNPLYPGFYELGPVSYPAPYPATLAGLLSRTVTNAGVPGEGTAAGLARFPGTLTTSQGVVLLLEGANDANGMNSSDDQETRLAKAQAVASNLRQMVDVARGQGKRVALATLTPTAPVIISGPDFPSGDIYHGAFPWAVAMVNSAIQSTMADLAGNPTFMLVDLYAAFGGDPPNRSLLSADGLHPSAAGYNVIANTFFNAVSAAGWR